MQKILQPVYTTIARALNKNSTKASHYYMHLEEKPSIIIGGVNSKTYKEITHKGRVGFRISHPLLLESHKFIHGSKLHHLLHHSASLSL